MCKQKNLKYKVTTIADNKIFGFYVSLPSSESHEKLVKNFVWGENGLNERLKPLKWQVYGKDFELILIQFYVNPASSLREALKEIGSYSRKEKSIAIPVILDQENFFRHSEIERQEYFITIIIERLELLKEKVKRNKLDLNLEKLKIDTIKNLN
ncbi:hypothetical protein CA264_09650 [Pontibacter actiniarum]|uniref:Uncharacterized protein n=2 Tax=Pontibacter actiniarum TaxID=323450 RepID=A0A1X9YS46_9BACT|nr:hypothetical protein CA264_09650 [Pontibacter actiniarum]